MRENVQHSIYKRQLPPCSYNTVCMGFDDEVSWPPDFTYMMLRDQFKVTNHWLTILLRTSSSSMAASSSPVNDAIPTLAFDSMSEEYTFPDNISQHKNWKATSKMARCMKGKPTPFSLGLNNQNFIIHIEFKMFKCYFSLFPLNNVQMSQIEHKFHYSNINIKSCVSLNIHKLSSHANKCLSYWSTPQCISANAWGQHRRGKNTYKYSKVVEPGHY